MRNARLQTSACRAAGAVASLLVAVTSAPAAQSDPQDFTQVARGRYLAIASDCASCHTVPGSGRPFTGGRPIETPFGNIVAPNITPDPETGIGAWSDDAFDAAVRRGLRPNGARLYPAMPFTAYTKMSRDDVLAIRAYLTTLQPVRNAVEANTLPFPFNIRAAMRVWDALYFREGEYKPDPEKSPAWNRGAFLVDGPGHCGACHTPKSLLGGDKTSQYLQGSALQGWFAPDITNDSRRGLGNWSVDDVAAYLRTGHNGITAATGPMAEEIALASSRMTDSDLQAIATYLKSLPARQDGPQPLSADNPDMVAGQAIYRDQCSACHGLEGKGVPRLFPSIAQSSSVRSNDPATLIRIVLRGARSVATDAEPTSPGMPSYGWQLDDAQVAAVLTYIRNAWGAAAPAVSAQDVGRARSGLALRPD
jgi:mono/diheme cytochrome c family protein